MKTSLFRVIRAAPWMFSPVSCYPMKDYREYLNPEVVSKLSSLELRARMVVEGFITGRTASAERLVREITLGAPPDASGRSEFSFEGTF